MNYLLITLNVVAVLVVTVLSLEPFGTPAHSLDYRSSMQAHPALLGETPQPQATPATQQKSLAF
ncbi:MAG: hypothetical protein ACN6QH_15720 [Pseudomonas sp.]|jgi:hypothetical protein|uniref:hypothetical protein n=1 Tax=Pseudomonas sp. TaxID=306 RepID=UPI003D12C7F2